MKLQELINLFEEIFRISDYENCDISLNGLQVGNPDKEVKKIAFAVDACQATIDKAVKEKADLLFVHHGLFWGKPLAVTGSHYKRIKTLIDNDICLFACHLPLDAHEKLGNNAQMAQRLKVKDLKPFSLWHGKYVGFSGTMEKALTNDEIVKALGVRVNPSTTVIGAGKKKSKTVAIVSGGAPEDVNLAIEDNLDVFITGENSHSVYHTCLENKINMLCLGHYETEVFGVKAVSEYIKANLGLETCFIDVPTRL